MAFDFNTATPEEIRAEAARRQGRRTGEIPPDPAQVKRRATVLEREEQAEIIKLYVRHRCVVYNHSQPRKAKYLSPGEADLLVMSPLLPIHNERGICGERRSLWYHETKRPKGGVYSDDQLKFAELCREAGITVLGGPLEVAQIHLQILGLA